MEPRSEFRRVRHRAGVYLPGYGFQTVVERVDQNDAEFAEELDHHPAESVGEIRARLYESRRSSTRRGMNSDSGSAATICRDVLGYLFVQFDVAYGLAFFGRTPGVSDSDELAFAVDEAGD